MDRPSESGYGSPVPHPRLLAAVTIACLALLAAGCSKKSTTATVATPPVLSGLPSSPFPEGLFPSGSPSTGSSGSSGGQVLEEGRHFGYIKSVDDGHLTLVFDRAQFFTGEAANDAAHEDGVIPEDVPVPNDVYIRNVNPQLRTVPIASDVQILIVNWDNCCGLIHGELAPFAHGFEEPGGKTTTGNYRGGFSPYWLTVNDGRIAAIEEQFLP